jgi:hypothetical protein
LIWEWLEGSSTYNKIDKLSIQIVLVREVPERV